MIATIVEQSKRNVECYVFQQSRFLPACLLLGLLVFIAQAANADEWKILPTLDLTETYTDNLRLQPKALQESAFITQISPGLSIVRDGPRFKLDLNYVLQNSYYSGDQHDSRTNHLLHGIVKSQLIDNLFFLDAKADITQQNLTPFGQVAETNLNLINNRSEIQTYSIAPFLKKEIGDHILTELRYARDSVNSNAGQNVDSKANTWQFGIGNSKADQVLQWGFRYVNQRINYVSQAPLTMESLTADVNLRLTPLFRLTATSGYEKNDYVSLSQKPEGYFWSSGFIWTPTERTNFTANIGHRYFGSTSSISISQRARTSVWSFGYHEDVSTTRGQYLLPATNNTASFLNQLWQTLIPDANARQQIVSNFIRDTGLPLALAQPVNTLTNQVFLQKNLQASVAIAGVRNTAVINLFNNVRESLSTGLLDTSLNPGLLNNVRQLGANTLWNWKMSPRSNATLDFSYIKNDSRDGGVREYNRIARTSFSRQMQEKLKATLEFRRVWKNSDIFSGNYDESAITLYLLIGLK